MSVSFQFQYAGSALSCHIPVSSHELTSPPKTNVKSEGSGNHGWFEIKKSYIYSISYLQLNLLAKNPFYFFFLLLLSFLKSYVSVYTKYAEQYSISHSQSDLEVPSDHWGDVPCMKMYYSTFNCSLFNGKTDTFHVFLFQGQLSRKVRKQFSFNFWDCSNKSTNFSSQ